jgi:hypothetical protein
MSQKSLLTLRKEKEQIEAKIERRERSQSIGRSNLEMPRGVLTEADREFLFNPNKEFSRQGRHQRRNCIQERIEASVIDLANLNSVWPVERLSVYANDDDIDEAIRLLEQLIDDSDD